MKPTLVVLAAGIGSRYGGLKQIDPVGPSGEIVIDYSVYDALKAGFGSLVFVIRDDIHDVFHETIGRRFQKLAPTTYVFQELTSLPEGCECPEQRTKPWGTGHALLQCRDAVHTPFCVINADDFYGRDAYATMASFLTGLAAGATNQYSMVSYQLANTLSEHGYVSRGICNVDKAGLIDTVVERTRIEKTAGGARFTDEHDEWQALTGQEPVSMNIWGFTPDIFDHLDEQFVSFFHANTDAPKAEFYIPTVVNELIHAGTATCRALSSSAQWFGVTYPEDKPLVVESIRNLVDQGAYPASLWG